MEEDDSFNEFHAKLKDIVNSVLNLGDVRSRPRPVFIGLLGQTHVNGWNRVIASQNKGSTSYISPFRLRVLQWSRHLFNYWDK